jgi:hypothetical protein
MPSGQECQSQGRRFSAIAPDLLLLVLVCGGTALLLVSRFTSGRAPFIYGQDALAFVLAAFKQPVWRPSPWPGPSYNPLQGTGDIFFPLYHPLTPHLWPVWLIPDIPLALVAIYVTAGALVAATGCLFARALGYSRVVAGAAGALGAVLALCLDQFTLATPAYLHAMASTYALLALLLVVGRSRRLGNAAALLLFVLLALAFLVSDVNSVLLSVPVLGILAAAGVGGAGSRDEAAWKVAAILVAGGLSVLLGAAQYAATVTTITARYIFADELTQPPQGAGAWGRLFEGDLASLALGTLCLLGVALELWRGNHARRAVALAATVILALWMLGGLLVVRTDLRWTAPMVAYFGFLTYPLIALLAIRGVTGVAARLVARLGHGGPIAQQRAVATAALAGLLMGAIPLNARLVTLTPSPDFHAATAGRIGLRPTPVLRFLQQEVGIQPGGSFRGYADAYFQTGQPFRSLTSEATGFWGPLAATYGNSHWTYGLHLFDIPTVTQYSVYTTPTYYAFFTRLLTRPEQYPGANLLPITDPNVTLLRMLGVRYLVTNQPWTPRPVDQPQVRQISQWETFTLYELANPNLGSYSPTTVQRAEGAGDVLRRLDRADFDPTGTAVIVEDEAEAAGGAGELVPAAASEITMLAGGFRVTAHSPGRSLLVLPFAFNRCLRAEVHAGDARASVLRVNLVQTGLLFERMVDVTLRYDQAGLAARCARFELADAERLGLRALAMTRRLPEWTHPNSDARWRLFEGTRWSGLTVPAGTTIAPGVVRGAAAPPPGASNLARQGTASQSSGGSAPLAIDGNTSGAGADSSLAQTDQDRWSWWQVDLGAPGSIDLIRIFGPTDPCCNERLRDFYVLISEGPLPPGDPAELRRAPGVASLFVPGSASPVTTVQVRLQGRYVRVQHATGGYLDVAEVEVWGRLD